MVQSTYPAHWLVAIGNAYEAVAGLERIFGPELTRLVWVKILGEAVKEGGNPSQKRGPKNGPRYPKADAVLLRAYDAIPSGYPKLTKRAPHRIGELCDEIHPGKYGQSADAIEKRLRRLLKAREARHTVMIRELVTSLSSVRSFAAPDTKADSSFIACGDKIS